MQTSTSPTGIDLVDKMAALLLPKERLAFEEGIERGYLLLQSEQRDLQRLWTLWCMKKRCPDIRIEQTGNHAIVTMHLGPCRTTLSADGVHATRRAFQRYGEPCSFYQTNNWCKHPQVPAPTCGALADELAEIAYLDGVPIEI